MDRVVQNHASVTSWAASALVEAALEEAVSIGVPENIAIVDASGHLVSFRRMDGAKFLAIEIAINKAMTASGARRATHELRQATTPGEPAFGIQTQHRGRFTTVPGGLPLVVDGVTIGGIGVSSGSANEDLRVASAAIQYLSSITKPAA